MIPHADPQPGPAATLHERVLLHHAAVQYAADQVGVPILLFKGPLVQEVFPLENLLRHSTDVDVFVRVQDLDRIAAHMLGAGWGHYDGTIEAEWHHSRVLHHPTYGCTVDLHTHYPGIHLGVDSVFEVLSRDQGRISLAGRTCSIPSRPVHALLVLLHSARGDSGEKGRDDIRRVAHTLTAEEMRTVVDTATELGCRPALSSVLPASSDGSIEARLWADVQQHPHDGAVRWMVRFIEADTWQRRWDVVRTAVLYPEKGSGPGAGFSSARLRRGLRQLPGVMVRLARARRR